MYKVLICDDEKLAIKSLSATVNWEKYGFEISGEAYDGLSALDIIVKMRPHLVFTDIRIPGMNGLELMKKVASLNIDTLFVVMSGYAEFAYVQKALNCGAIGYCLKPFEESEILSILKKAKRFIDMSKSSVETELLTMILDRNPDSGKKKTAALKSLGFDWEKGNSITGVVVKCPQKLEFLSDVNNVNMRLGNNKSAYIIHTCDLKEAEGRLMELQKSCPDISAGISNPCFNPGELHNLVLDASIASDQCFMNGKNGIYYYENLQKNDFNKILIQLRGLLSKKDFTETMKFFDFIGDAFTKGGYNVKNAFELFNIIMYYSQTVNVNDCRLLDDYEQLAALFKNVSEMLAYLKNMLAELFEVHNGNFAVEVKNETLRNIIKYVNEEFFDDLSIQTIANRFTINPNYVSQLFKKETGVTFTEYLTNLRVNYAICLLKTTDLPVSSVAEKSGFRDYFYFTRVFKKSTGKTPTAYRSQYGAVEHGYNAKIFEG